MPDVFSLAGLRIVTWSAFLSSLFVAGLCSNTHAADRTQSENAALSQIEEIPWPSKPAKPSPPNESKDINNAHIKNTIKSATANVVPISSVSTSGTEANSARRQSLNKPLHSIKASIEAPQGDLPKMDSVDDVDVLGIVDPFSNGLCRPWAYSCYQWEAPATRHLPLLFEEPNLERLGYTYGFCDVGLCDEPPRGGQRIQPLISMVNFIGRIPFIPYMAGVHPLTEPVYTLGVDRPGSPVPYRKYLPHCSLRGTIYQAGFMVGTAFIIP
jgi:hypothetical protein